MAEALTPFRKLQVGIETTSGTLVAATRQLIGEWNFTEPREYYRSSYPAGVNANVGGAGVATQNASRLEVSTELTFEELIWVLSLGVKGGITPTTSTDTETWVFTPEITGIPTIKGATFEVMEFDGVTNHIAREFGYGLVESFGIEWAAGAEAKLNYTVFGRASQTTTPTAALSPMPDREIALSNRLRVYMNDVYADLGDTQLTGIVRSASFNYTGPFAPDYTLDGRTDMDMTKHISGMGYKATLNMVMELDATAATIVTDWRDNSLRYFRLSTIGSVIQTTETKDIIIDGAYRFTSDPVYSDADGVRLVAFDLESVYDTTGTKTLEFTVVNEMATL